MKRDIDLYRKILLAMEAEPSAYCTELRDLPDVPHELFAYHVGLLHEAGLIRAIDASSMDGPDWIPVQITHAGHEFIDNMRSDSLWEKTKRHSASTLGTLSIEALKSAASALIKHQLGF